MIRLMKALLVYMISTTTDINTRARSQTKATLATCTDEWEKTRLLICLVMYLGSHPKLNVKKV